MLNLEGVQDAIAEHLVDSIAQKCYEQSIPDADTVRRNSDGSIPYYVTYQFGTLRQKFRGKTFAGVRHDDYQLVVQIQVIGPEPTMTRKVGNRVSDAMLGADFDWCSEMVPEVSGAMFPMVQSNNATEAYVVPLSFGVTFQMAEAEKPELPVEP